MNFLQNGGADFLAGAVSIVVIFTVMMVRLRRLERGKKPLTASPPDGEVRMAQTILLRVIGTQLQNRWLRELGDVRYRITPFEEVFLVERVECATWPPEPRSKIVATGIVVQADKDYAPRFSVEVEVTERRTIPVSVRAKSDRFIVNGTQRTYTQAEAREIIQWMQALSESHPD